MEANFKSLGACVTEMKYLVRAAQYAKRNINKTKDWALVQNAALVGVEVSLG